MQPIWPAVDEIMVDFPQVNKFLRRFNPRKEGREVIAQLTVDLHPKLVRLEGLP
jgi:hypothetical protein